MTHLVPPTPVAWFPFCGSTSCPCMEPNLSGPCDEHKESPTNPRCAECGWPEHRHVTVRRDSGSPWVNRHPSAAGAALRQQLAGLGITQAEAARRMGISAKHMNQVLVGAAAMSVDFAVQLTLALGIDGRALLHLQADDQFEKTHQLLAEEYE